MNRAQQQAVRHVDGPLLVLAGAGSGKTSVITEKIYWLIQHCGIKARKIAAVTFTNKAAREMKQRVQLLLPEDSGQGLRVSTFHNLGLNIIQRELRHLDRKPGFSIFDEYDSKTLLKELILDHSDSATELIDLFQNQISGFKNEGMLPSQVMAIAASPREQQIAEVFRRYEEALGSYNAVDFDDLIGLPLHLFQTNNEALTRWQKRIGYLLVDEYQDTNTCQYELVKLLVGPRSGLTVVGDDDQSIYAWRGAKPENLAQLEADFPTLKVIKLEQNYRSTNRILRAANQLISNNSHMYDKKLWSEKGLGDEIQVVRVNNEEIENERITNEIMEQKLRRRVRFKDFAVLVRSNHQTRSLEMALQAKQLPYHVTGGTSFFARAEIKDAMAYLRLLVNPDDDTAFLRIINVPRRKIGAQTLQVLGQYAGSRESSLYSAAGEIGLREQMEHSSQRSAHERLTQFIHWFENLRREVDNGNALSAIREMLDDIDYPGWLNQNSSSPAVAERRWENVLFLVDAVAKELGANSNKESPEDEGIVEEPTKEEATLEAVIRKLMLRDLLEQQSEEAADDKIQIMTLHASKGLEFPHVFIKGFEENLLPHHNSIEQETIEEERRLAYVGITRAEQSLTLLMCRQRKQFGDLLNCEPSRFLAELPQEDLQYSGFDEQQDAAANQEKGNATLESLKGLFD